MKSYITAYRNSKDPTKLFLDILAETKEISHIEFRIIVVIALQADNFNISAAEIGRRLKLTRQHISYHLINLELRNVISVIGKGFRGSNIYKINMPEEWKLTTATIAEAKMTIATTAVPEKKTVVIDKTVNTTVTGELTVNPTVIRELTRHATESLHDMQLRVDTNHLSNHPIKSSENKNTKKEKPTTPSKQRKPRDLRYRCIIDAWDKYRGNLPEKDPHANDYYVKKAKVRFREKPDPEYWVTAVKKLAASKFANGKTDIDWVATLRWLLQKPDNHMKVMEGIYDNKLTIDDKNRIFAEKREQRQREVEAEFEERKRLDKNSNLSLLALYRSKTP